MAVTVNFFDNFIQDIGLQRMNLATDSFKVILVNGYIFNRGHNSKASITGELSTGSGYTADGIPLSQAWTVDSSSGAAVTKFDSDDVSWTVSSGGIIGPCTGAIIYDDTTTTPTNDRLMCYIDFGGSESAGPSTEFKIVFDANGIFTIG